jgi:hyperosmotically inducible protein
MNKRSPFLLSAVLAAALLASGCSKPPEATAMVPAASAPVASVSDIDVTEHVKTSLQQNEALKGFDITVMTTNGDVRLSGMVDTRAQIDAAVQIARAAEGAHAVHDELAIKK